MKEKIKIDEFTEFKITKRQLIIFAIIVILILVTLIIKMADKPNQPISKILPERPSPEINKEPESATAYAQVDSLKVMSPSDELEAIEADLNSTNLDSLTLELQTIERELGE
ncbi:MAG: hypothetical protein R3B60_01570 [Candidatus Paceibacterota bacterium]